MSLLARLLLLAMALLATPARAQDAADAALSRFSASGFAEVEQGVFGIAGSGLPTAQAILEALADGRLMVRAADKAVFIKAPDGAILDARTGAATEVMASALKPVRVNNRLRRAIEQAMGSLTMMSPDPAKRRESAESVFRSRDVAALEPLDAALAAEKDPAVALAFRQARAALLIGKADAPQAERVEAAGVLTDRGDAEAAGDDHARIEPAGVINMAHGEMVMLGAYATYVVQLAFREWMPDWLGASVVVAVPAAFVVTGLVGVAIERGIIRFLYGRPLETLLATWGLSLILQQLVRSLFGPNNREVITPGWMSGTLEVTAGLSLTWNRIVIFLFAMAVFAALLVAIKRTAFGLEMRAVTQNRRMAGSMGIRTPWVDALTFGLGSGIAGIAGVALAQIDNVSPNLGQSYIIDSFMVVVFGGVGNLWGTLTGALTLGIVNKFLEPVAGAVLAKILVLIALIVFIQKRPRGLFALRGRAVEA